MVPKDCMALAEDEVEQYSRKHLAGYKVPKKIALLMKPPKLAVGKISRRELQGLRFKSTVYLISNSNPSYYLLFSFRP